ncbi:hypothetical protein B0H13DRAFT_2343583 [Mycena leptocephala]|nr:hypothetical protein B0H13DRAFT_2343583 [Mycena leptocephala]
MSITTDSVTPPIRPALEPALPGNRNDVLPWYMSTSGTISLSSRTVFDITEDLVRGAADDSDSSDFPTYCAPSLKELVDLLPRCVPKCFERQQDGRMMQKWTIYFLVEGHNRPYQDYLRAGKRYLKLDDPNRAIFVCTSSREFNIQLTAEKGLSLSEYEIAQEQGLDLDAIDPTDFDIMNLTC